MGSHKQVTVESAKAASALPSNLVCSAVCMEAIEQFRSVQVEAGKASGMFNRPSKPDLVLSTFPKILDSQDLMFKFANKWKTKAKALPSKASAKDKNDAFRACVQEFYPLVFMDHKKMPKNLDVGPDAASEERAKLVNDFLAKKKVNRAKIEY